VEQAIEELKPLVRDRRRERERSGRRPHGFGPGGPGGPSIDREGALGTFRYGQERRAK
jgi:hypothetical protein